MNHRNRLQQIQSHKLRIHRVACWFSIEKGGWPFVAPPAFALPRPGEIVLIVGSSGAGKSTLLRSMRQRWRLRSRSARSWIDLPRLRLPDRPIVNCFARLTIEATLESLSRVGLAEARCYLAHPHHLSDGQRWRLRLAVALARHRPDAPSCLVADEFAALLDRVTAAVVSRALRRTIDKTPHLCALLATCHEDVEQWLKPDRIIRADFESWTEHPARRFHHKSKAPSPPLSPSTSPSPSPSLSPANCESFPALN